MMKPRPLCNLKTWDFPTEGGRVIIPQAGGGVGWGGGAGGGVGGIDWETGTISFTTN